jgi:hypothetical protein
MPFNKPGYIGGNAVKTGLQPAVIYVKGLLGSDSRVRMGLVKVFKIGLHILILGFRGLLVRVFLQGKQIIGSGGDNLVGYFVLTAHSIYRDDTSFQGYHLQQGRYGGDFIMLFLGFHRGKH